MAKWTLDHLILRIYSDAQLVAHAVLETIVG
jgi:hypothetical protein